MARRTRSQTQLLEILQTLEDPISAQDLYIRLREHNLRMGLATVYRALDALKLDGTVQVRTLPSGESLYSLAHADRHHLTCLNCGSTILIDECPVHELAEQLNHAHHFQIFYHTLEFFGLCAQCQGA